MPSPIGATDATAAIQAAMNAAFAAGRTYNLPVGGHRLTSTGLGYQSNARIVLDGDLYNDHGPLVGTLHCLTNRTGQRVRNVTIRGGAGFICGASTPANGATRKGLGIVATDGFTVMGVQTHGPLTGFGFEVKNSTGGYLNKLRLFGGANIPGADGLHFFGGCSRVSGSDIQVSSGDDALSFTCENWESLNTIQERITLTGLTLDTAAFSCIKFYTGMQTGTSIIRNIRLSNITGRITQGPTGGPLIMRNDGAANGCRIENISIDNADLDCGVTSVGGASAFLTDLGKVTLNRLTLRGRMLGEFVRAERCTGLTITGEAWETVPGNRHDLIQLKQCSDYNINLVIRSATGQRLGAVVARNSGTDAGTRYLNINAA